jgi:hypothetical protein
MADARAMATILRADAGAVTPSAFRCDPFAVA